MAFMGRAKLRIIDRMVKKATVTLETIWYDLSHDIPMYDIIIKIGRKSR